MALSLTIQGGQRGGGRGYHLLLWCPDTETGQHTRDPGTRAGWDNFAFSYCLCYCPCRPFWPIGPNILLTPCSGAWISSVLASVVFQAGDSHICLVLGLPYAITIIYLEVWSGRSWDWFPPGQIAVHLLPCPQQNSAQFLARESFIELLWGHIPFWYIVIYYYW